MRGLLLDLDDTLYAYAPAEQAAREDVIDRIARDCEREPAAVEELWRASRGAVQARLGTRGSAHSRLLYLSELAHRSNLLGALGRVREWERRYWEVFLRHARLRPGAPELLERWRRRGGRIAVVSDLTLEVQLWKLEHFELLSKIDVLVTSEEVAFDKPALDSFRLAIRRLGLRPEDCVAAGDDEEKEGAAARALAIPFVPVDPKSADLFETIAKLEAVGWGPSPN